MCYHTKNHITKFGKMFMYRFKYIYSMDSHTCQQTETYMYSDILKPKLLHNKQGEANTNITLKNCIATSILPP